MKDRSKRNRYARGINKLEEMIFEADMVFNFKRADQLKARQMHVQNLWNRSKSNATRK